MARYQGPDATFDVPTDWDDKSIVAFSAPSKPNAVVPNVVFTKDKLKPDESLEQYVDRTIVDMAKQLSQFKLLARSPRDISGISGFELKFTWQGSGGKTVLQRIVMVPLSKRRIAGLNVTCDRTDEKKVEAVAERILASFRLTP
jgi:hypothetical protein